MSRNYDNWEKLVGAVLRREKDRQLAYCESFDSSSSSVDLSSRFSFEVSFAGDVHYPAPPVVSRSIGQKIDHSDQSSSNIFLSHDVRTIKYKEMRKATGNFRGDYVLGEGLSTIVYKGWIDEHRFTAVKPGFGIAVAVKKIKQLDFLYPKKKKLTFPNSVLHTVTDFRSEVEILTKIEHRNIVKLLGYVEKGKKRLIIMEYVPNGTLREHLDGLKGRILDFNQRLDISIAVAHALTYLHQYAEKQIIHRDVNSFNILLNESLRTKVAGFGLACFGNDTEKSTAIKGTVGYLDPEYRKTRLLTTKTDVYSFGILLLEIFTGRRPVDRKRPPDEKAFPEYNEGRISEMLDPLIQEHVDKEILVKIFCLAYQCAALIRADRPDMKAVEEQLWGIRMNYLKSVKKE